MLKITKSSLRHLKVLWEEGSRKRGRMFLTVIRSLSFKRNYYCGFHKVLWGWCMSGTVFHSLLRAPICPWTLISCHLFQEPSRPTSPLPTPPTGRAQCHNLTLPRCWDGPLSLSSSPQDHQLLGALPESLPPSTCLEHVMWPEVSDCCGLCEVTSTIRLVQK